MHGPAYVDAKKWYMLKDINDSQKLFAIPQVKNIIGIDNDQKNISIILLAQQVFFSRASARKPLTIAANVPQKQFIIALYIAYSDLKIGKFLPKNTGK